jgi:hypothetical protein
MGFLLAGILVSGKKPGRIPVEGQLQRLNPDGFRSNLTDRSAS